MELVTSNHLYSSIYVRFFPVWIVAGPFRCICAGYELALMKREFPVFGRQGSIACVWFSDGLVRVM